MFPKDKNIEIIQYAMISARFLTIQFKNLAITDSSQTKKAQVSS